VVGGDVRCGQVLGPGELAQPRGEGSARAVVGALRLRAGDERQRERRHELIGRADELATRPRGCPLVADDDIEEPVDVELGGNHCRGTASSVARNSSFSSSPK
jgi:hypothetical protein